VFFCVVVIVLGVWGLYEASEKHIWGRKPMQIPEILPCEGKGCMSRRVVHLAIANPRIFTTAALSKTLSHSNYRSQSFYISPLESPLRVSHVSHERHPTSLART
jgi:hypothetical protein